MPERGAQVLVLALEYLDRGTLSGAAEQGVGGTGQLPEVHEVPAFHGFPLPRPVEALRRVLADGLQEAVAHPAVRRGHGDDQGLVDE